MLTAEPPADKAWSTSFTRGSSDQKQVESLKRRAYEVGATELVKLSSADAPLAR
jgi:hypothetical protein